MTRRPDRSTFNEAGSKQTWRNPGDRCFAENTHNRESGSLVTDDYPAQNAFTGKLDWVDLSIGPAEADHLIDPQEFLKIAMVRQ
jgi:hypothetical protein